MNSEDYKIAYENVMIANKMLEQEIERLKELCDKYEEEHKTTFETWQKDIKENKLLHSIIKEVKEYIKPAFEDGEYGIYKDTGDDCCEHYDNFFEGLYDILDKEVK